MIRSAILSLALAAMLLPMVSCTKHELKKESNYTFTNNTDKRLTVDVYNTAQDYTNNTNRANQYFVDPYQDLKIKLKAPATIFLDWYSDNYSYNNWGKANGNTLLAQMPVAIEDDHVYFNFSSYYPDTSRSVLMNGNNSSSTWLLTAPSSAGSLAGTYRFVFRKDFTGEYSFTSPGGSTSAGNFHYYKQNYGSSTGTGVAGPFSIGFSLNDRSNQGMDFELYARRQSYPYDMTSRDTLYAVYNNYGSAYTPAVRQ